MVGQVRRCEVRKSTALTPERCLTLGLADGHHVTDTKILNTAPSGPNFLLRLPTQDLKSDADSVNGQLDPDSWTAGSPDYIRSDSCSLSSELKRLDDQPKKELATLLIISESFRRFRKKFQTFSSGFQLPRVIVGPK